MGVLPVVFCFGYLLHSTAELELLAHVSRVSSEAHVDVMRAIKPGMAEYQLEALFCYHIYDRAGCRSPAYTCICACGPNAGTLHYGHAGAPNSRILKETDIALVRKLPVLLRASVMIHHKPRRCAMPITTGCSPFSRAADCAAAIIPLCMHRLARHGGRVPCILQRHNLQLPGLRQVHQGPETGEFVSVCVGFPAPVLTPSLIARVVVPMHHR